ncbi:polysaccharide lyase 8 family protein [Propioniciclava coleopterorum]|uniref:Polysaccharide lyase 8 family protein n=1 Tax=Propioniciclava coleopterorum TaxID=2714937 RepID=A0A6G7YAP7_9ACTN|nr:polysaccharide lyase 8 family protein [Propioniciclava coleopterorum]QIK73721.1 polysaccharide lyase 8 family protein [Propioniciclava coleopterorum]
MTALSRRTVLQGAGATALAIALGPVFARSAAAAPLLTAPDLEKLRLRWVDDLTSRTVIAASPAAFAAQIRTMDSGVDKRLAAISPTATRYFADKDWAVGATPTVKSNNMRLTYSDLQTMATAYATPGSRHQGSARVLAAVRAGLKHMDETVYNTRTVWFGNWWSWMIGATKPLADIMALLHDELDQSEIDAYCAAMDHFLPQRDPQLQIHPNGVQSSDGANRVDICRAFIVRSIVQPDTALLQASVAALSPTWQYVTSGNGFFADGSFVQHSTIGYTGTYGLVLLEGLSKLFALLADTGYDITDPSRVNLTRAIEDSYAPFMFQGQMMDAVRGRAVARPQERSIDNGDQLIEYTLRMAKAVDATTAARWRGLARQWIESNGAAKIAKTTNIGRLALVTELLASDVAPVADPVGTRLFPAMDRAVHRGADGTWAATVAMCSRRIAWHEGTEAENFAGVKTSQGMTYLYLGGDDDHFDDEFWSTSDLAAPPGATVDLTPLPRNPEGTWGDRTPANEWTGGVTFEGMGWASMHLIGPGGTGLRARKSWLFLPDRVVALGADIATASAGAVRTIVEHRNLGTTPRALVLDGRPVTDPRTVQDARWAHLDGVGGYVLLQDGSLTASVAERTGSWLDNSTSTVAGSGDPRRRTYATLAWEHGTGAAASGGYAYVLLPGASVARTQEVARKAGVAVLRNDAVAQAVQIDKHVMAASFWKPGEAGHLAAASACCLFTRSTNGMTAVAVSDPTQEQDAVEFTVLGRKLGRATGQDRARVTVVGSTGAGTTVRVDVRGLGGLTAEFKLH